MAILSDDNSLLKNISKVKGVPLLNRIMGVILLPFLFLKVTFNGLMLPVA
jgi:hypothetical protein